MRNRHPGLSIALVLGALLCGLPVYAALTTGNYIQSGALVGAPTNCPLAQNSSGQCTQAVPCGTSGTTITFYVPHSAPNCATSIEGCIATSRKSLTGACEPMTVDSVRLGKSKYATCASDPSNYGKFFNMGTITYRSALDMQMHTVPNVICFVHDTGGAFQGRPDKLDLATTVCPTCSDAQAGVIGRGGSVNLVGGGPLNTLTSFFTNTFSASAVPIGYPTGIGSANIGGNNPILTQDYYCVTSIEPVIVVPLPAGSQFPSGACYNQAPANSLSRQPFSYGAPPPPPPPPQQQPSAPVASTPSSLQPQQPGQSPVTTILPPATSTTPVGLIIVQPQSVVRGTPLIVSWSTLGMSTQTPCQVAQNSAPLSQGNSGSTIVQTRALGSGTIPFTLSCTTAAGQIFSQSTSALVQ